MKSTYNYVVLRLAVDAMRGEVINIGILLLEPEQPARPILMATLNKLRAIDASWNSQRLTAWVKNIETIVANYRTAIAQVQALARFGFCESDAVGMFTAESPEELAKHLARIKATYVANKQPEDKPKREKRTRLQTALREQFKRMHVLGETMDDLAQHLVVSNVPVPEYPDLKADFVYKNGTYRITQTLDYHVAPDSLHNKLTEACVKSTAAELAVRHYGATTKRLAVFDVPDEYASAVDSHVDLLHAQGFEIFHFDDSTSMADYLTKAAPHAAMN